MQFEMSSVAAWEQPIDALAVTGGGSVRGSILHKLMEELLAGELRESPDAAQERAVQLIRQLVPAGPPAGLEAQELARTALRTFALPEFATIATASFPRCLSTDALAATPTAW